MLGGEAGHRMAQVRKLGARLAGGLVHAGADLELGFEELARHLPLQRLLRGIKQRLRHLTHEVTARAIDEKVFLLDANAEGRILDRHGGNVGTICRRFKSKRRCPALPWWGASGRRAGSCPQPRAATAWCGTASERSRDGQCCWPWPRPG